MSKTTPPAPIINVSPPSVSVNLPFDLRDFIAALVAANSPPHQAPNVIAGRAYEVADALIAKRGPT